jgi:hypothetical protein
MADAKADGDLVVVGGFEVLPGTVDLPGRWFSYRLTPACAPWAFAKEGQAFRAIAAIELCASLICVLAFSDSLPQCSHSVMQIRGTTDNQSNEALVVKHMTTKFPSYIIIGTYRTTASAERFIGAVLEKTRL